MIWANKLYFGFQASVVRANTSGELRRTVLSGHHSPTQIWINNDPDI